MRRVGQDKGVSDAPPPCRRRGRRVALVSDAVYPYNRGGKEVRIHELSRRQRQYGVEVTIYTMRWWPQGPAPCISGVPLQGLCRFVPLYSGGRRSIRQAVVFALASLRLVVGRYDVLDADQVPFLHLFPLRLVASIRRRPLVVTWHEVWGADYWRHYLGRWGPLAAHLERLAARLPDQIVAASPDTAARLRRLTNGKADVTLVTNGVDYEEVEAATPDADPDVGEVLVVGRLLRHKGTHLVLDALALLSTTRPALRCTIIGEGPEMQRLHDRVQALGLGDRVDLRGALANRADVLKAMAGAQVLAFPSVREGFGMVAIEAMACGLPVVTADHPDNYARNLVRDGVDGYICTPTASGLAQAVDRALDAHDRLGAAARAAAQTYSWDVQASRLARVYGA